MIAFDLDGVLIDSIPTMELAWSECRKAVPALPLFERYKKHIGLPFERICAEIGVERALVEQIKAMYFNASEYYSSETKLYADIAALIESLRDAGIIVAIITSKPRDRSEGVLRQLSLVVDFLLTPDDVSFGKPDKESFVKLFELTGVRCYETLYVGDMKSDAQFALNARVKYIQANWGWNKIPKEDLHHESLAVDSPSELWEFLANVMVETKAAATTKTNI